MASETSFKYPDWAKIPENYDFSTRGNLTRQGLEKILQRFYTKNRRSMGKNQTKRLLQTLLQSFQFLWRNRPLLYPPYRNLRGVGPVPERSRAAILWAPGILKNRCNSKLIRHRSSLVTGRWRGARQPLKSETRREIFTSSALWGLRSGSSAMSRFLISSASLASEIWSILVISIFMRWNLPVLIIFLIS